MVEAARRGLERGAIFVLVAVICLATVAVESAASNRVALVIGNGTYRNAPPLKNPVNDAKLMAATLRDLGFDVIEHLDVNQRQMKRAIRDFGDLLDKAGEDGIGMFYYAGHGLQVQGRNFLIPLDTEIERESDVRIEAVAADLVLETMDFARTNLNFVVLDACRNNPFARGFRSVGRGLARMDAPRGTMIAYATAPGEVAADGDGDNSPYTTALTKAMRAPGLPVERMFREVRNEVMERTKDLQVPWEASSLTGEDFYFNTVAPAPPATAATPGPAPATGMDTAIWGAIKDCQNPVDYQTFLAQFPNSPLAPFARARFQALGGARTAAIIPSPATTGPVAPLQRAVGVYPKGFVPGSVFRDCPFCPEMVMLPTGRFIMGSPAREAGRKSHEGPQFQVTMGRPLAMGKHEITRDQFAEFVFETSHNYGVGCTVYEGRKRTFDQARTWQDPGYRQDGDHPAVCISWEDAQAYTVWLSRKTGGNYRLPTEAEWEYAARAGTTTSRFWGDDPAQACAHANVYDRAAEKTREAPYDAFPCDDGFAEAAPVGRFAANAFGLHDMVGNVREWTQDCWYSTLKGAPSDGTVRDENNCKERVRRGGTWQHPVSYARSANRGKTGPANRVFLIGFRVVWMPIQ